MRSSVDPQRFAAVVAAGLVVSFVGSAAPFAAVSLAFSALSVAYSAPASLVSARFAHVSALALVLADFPSAASLPPAAAAFLGASGPGIAVFATDGRCLSSTETPALTSCSWVQSRLSAVCRPWADCRPSVDCRPWAECRFWTGPKRAQES